MSRKNLIRNSEGVYHITSRCNNRDWFGIPLDDVWRVFSYNLQHIAQKYALEIHAFTLMPNHYHLFASTPFCNLDSVMRDLLTRISKRLGFESGRINHIFGGRYKWSLVLDPISVAYVMKYVLRNPVRAGLCERVEDFRYSTARFRLGERYMIPVSERTGEVWRRMRQLEDRSLWLNQPTFKEAEDMIRRGLKRHEFKLSTSKTVRADLASLKQTYGCEALGYPS